MSEETIGQRLKRLRLAAGLSIRAFAKHSGVDREHIYQIEGGKVKSPTLRTAQRLAKGLGRSPSVFFDEPPETTATLKKSIADLAELSINLTMLLALEEKPRLKHYEPIGSRVCVLNLKLKRATRLSWIQTYLLQMATLW